MGTTRPGFKEHFRVGFDKSWSTDGMKSYLVAILASPPSVPRLFKDHHLDISITWTRGIVLDKGRRMIGISIHISCAQSVVHASVKQNLVVFPGSWYFKTKTQIRGNTKWDSKLARYLAKRGLCNLPDSLSQGWVRQAVVPGGELLYSIAFGCVPDPPGSCISQLLKILAPSFLWWWVAGSLTLSCLSEVELG